MPDSREVMIRGGERLRRLREERHITQQEMERRTAEQFGRENRVYAQQVSRIEKGQLDKPPIIDLLRMGQILGLTPDDVADLFDLWPVRGTSKPLDARLQAAIDVAQMLEGQELERFLEWIQFATLQARAEHRRAQRSAASGAASPPTPADVR